MDIEVLIESYNVLKQYIPQKDRQEAADNLMSILVELLSDPDLKELGSIDSAMKRALKEYAADEEDDYIDEEDE